MDILSAIGISLFPQRGVSHDDCRLAANAPELQNRNRDVRETEVSKDAKRAQKDVQGLPMFGGAPVGYLGLRA